MALAGLAKLMLTTLTFLSSLGREVETVPENWRDSKKERKPFMTVTLYYRSKLALWHGGMVSSKAQLALSLAPSRCR